MDIDAILEMFKDTIQSIENNKNVAFAGMNLPGMLFVVIEKDEEVSGEDFMTT